MHFWSSTSGGLRCVHTIKAKLSFIVRSTFLANALSGALTTSGSSETREALLEIQFFAPVMDIRHML